MTRFSTMTFLLTSLAALLTARAAEAGKIEVIYTEISTSGTSIVPGALDASGDPAVTNFLAIEEAVVRQDGGQWIVKGRTTQATTLDSILLIGSGISGTMFCQDGQPFQGGVTGELYDFFDTPVPAVWDDNGMIAFGARAKGGVAAVFEKLVKYNPITNTHTIAVQMGDDALGLIDVPANTTGDEKFGNSMNATLLLNDGTVGFVNTPITNCHSSRYPAMFRNHTSFRQSGVSAIGGGIWDGFGLSDAGGSPDGVHWFAEGDDEGPTATDLLLAVDDVVVLREGSPVVAAGPVLADIFFTRMLPNGDWYCRGDDPTDNDWAVRNGALLAKTGDLISGSEHWGAVFSGLTGNQAGDWILEGNTDNTDPNVDNVLVRNGTQVMAREGDAVDVDGNGAFDDDAFISAFQPNDVQLTDNHMVYFLVNLRNGAATAIGDAFLRMCVFEPCDTNCDGSVNLFDIDRFVDALSQTGTVCSGCAADVNEDGSINLFDIDGFVACLSN